MEAINHPGFSMVQGLSPCVTFRPEQSDWKNILVPAPKGPTSDPGEAARRLLLDHGLYTGVLYKGDRPVHQPELKSSIGDIAELDEEFHL